MLELLDDSNPPRPFLRRSLISRSVPGVATPSPSRQEPHRWARPLLLPDSFEYAAHLWLPSGPSGSFLFAPTGAAQLATLPYAVACRSPLVENPLPVLIADDDADIREMVRT